MQKINFIPGLGEKPKDYIAISKYLNVVDIDWNNCRTSLGKVDTLIGFSLGGILACMHTEKNKVKKLILCSPTPMENMDDVKADEIIFLVGSKEKWALQNIHRIYKKLKCKKTIIIIPGAEHKITGNYRKKLLELIKDNYLLSPYFIG